MKRIFALLLALVLTFGCLAVTALADGEPAVAGDGVQYRLVEEDAALNIDMEQTPLSAPPQMCCALHFVLMLSALVVAIYFTHDRKVRQARIRELRLADLK